MASWKECRQAERKASAEENTLLRLIFIFTHLVVREAAPATDVSEPTTVCTSPLCVSVNLMSADIVAKGDEEEEYQQVDAGGWKAQGLRYVISSSRLEQIFALESPLPEDIPTSAYSSEGAIVRDEREGDAR